jgi:mercuric ion binding protein
MKLAWTLIASFFLAASLAAASDSDQTATFDVENMTCATCPIAVSKAMQRVDGVKKVNVDLDSNTAIVTYDSNITSATEIGDASTDVGFPASLRDSE